MQYKSLTNNDSVSVSMLLHLLVLSVFVGSSHCTAFDSYDLASPHNINARQLLNVDEVDAISDNQLPLRVVTTAPSIPTSGAAVSLSGQDAIQVVFSRSLIALGSDFGNTDPISVPFSLVPKVPGKFRWVTTYIARWDPDASWKADLNVTFVWNRNLVSWDGAPLMDGTLKDFQITTPRQSMELTAVSSAAATNATDGQWASNWFENDDAGDDSDSYGDYDPYYSDYDTDYDSISIDSSSGGSTIPADDEPVQEVATFEVPFDGIVTLEFEAPVSIQLLQKALTLKVVTKGVPGAVVPQMNVSTCTREFFPVDSFFNVKIPDPKTGLVPQVCVSFKGPGLTPGVDYSIVLPAGSIYDSEAGGLSTKQSVLVTGLRPFTIPIRSDLDPASNSSRPILSQRLRILLPHGHSNNTTPEVIKKQVKLVDNTGKIVPSYSVKYINSATVQLSGVLKPKTDYALVVTGTTASKDVPGAGIFSNETFAQPLTLLGKGPSERTPFRTGAESSSNIAVPEWSDNLFIIDSRDEANLTWPVLAQGEDTGDTGPFGYLAVQVKAPMSKAGAGVDLVAALKRWLFSFETSTPLPRNTPGSQQVTFPEHSNGTSATLLELDVKPLLKSSGLVLLEQSSRGPCKVMSLTCRPCPGPPSQDGSTCLTQLDSARTPSLLSSTTLSIAIAKVNKRVTVWATNLKDGSHAANVTLTIYGITDEEPIKGQPDHWKSGSATTDEQGLATLVVGNSSDTLSSSYSFVAVFTTPDKSILVRRIDSNFASSGIFERPQKNPAATGILVTDGALYTPGDTVYVKGYVQTLTPNGAAPLMDPSLKLTVASWTDDSTNKTEYKLDVDPKYGTFEVELTVPLDASLSRSVNIALRRGKSEQLSSSRVLVADPRLPTAELNLTAPAWVRATGMLIASIRAESLIGANIANAPMTLSWTYGSADGTVDVVTDLEGNANVTLSLASIKPPQEAPDSISLELEYIGPTRERLVASTEVTVALNEYFIRLDFTTEALNDDVFNGPAFPGQSFGLLATVARIGDTTYVSDADITLSFKKTTAREIDEFISFGITPYRQLVDPASTDADTVICVLKGGPGETSWDRRWDACRWTVPDSEDKMTAYEVTACAMPEGVRVCASQVVGQTYDQWVETPLDEFPKMTIAWKLAEGATGFEVGDVAQLFIENPLTGGSNSAQGQLFWWGVNSSGLVSVPELKGGLNTVNLTVPAACATGCTVALIASHTADTFVPVPTFPINYLFDPSTAGIQSVESKLPISVKDKELVVSFPGGNSTTPMIVQPGENSTITVDVSLCPSGDVDSAACTASKSDVQVTLIAVDKAWLQLLEYEQPDLAAAFQIDWSPGVEVANTLESLISTSSLDQLAAAALRRSAPNPWLKTSLQLDDTFFASQSDAEFEDDFFNNLSPFPNTFGFQSLTSRSGSISFASASRASSQKVLQAEATSSDEGQGQGSQGETRSSANFIRTPLFEVKEGKAGQPVSFTFSAPENLGTFDIRAYAVSASSKFAQAGTEVIVRRDLSLTGSVPRIVRIGDEFQAGVIVTLTKAAVNAVTVSVSVSVSGDVELLPGSTTKMITFPAGIVTQEVRFGVLASAVGDALLTFSAKDSAGGSDILEFSLPVAGLQAPVHLASSFAVQGNGSVWTEGLALPDAAPGTGVLDLLAGVGKLPAVQSQAASLLSLAPTKKEYENAPYYLATLLTRPSLLQYSAEALMTIVTVPVREALYLRASYIGGQGMSEPTEVDLNKATMAELDKAVEVLALGGLTLKSLGLTYNGRSRGFSKPDVYLNLYGSWVVQRMNALVDALPPTLQTSLKGKVAMLTKLAETWTRIGTQELVAQAVNSRMPSQGKPVPYSSLTNIILLRTVNPGFSPKLISDEVAKKSGNKTLEASVAADLSLNRLYKSIPEMNVEQTAWVTLLLVTSNTTNNAAQAALQTAVDQLTNRFRVTARTAYLSDSPGDADAAPQSAQALSLMALTANDQLTPAPASYAVLAEKLSNYIGTDASAPGIYNYPSAYYASSAMQALAVYDKSKGSTTPNLNMKVRSGNSTLLQAAFTSASDPIAQSRTLFSALPDKPAPLEFMATGSGEVTVAAVIEFVPSTLLPFPVYRGIQVDVNVRLDDPAEQVPVGKPQSTVALASLVHVTAQVTTPDDLGASTLSILMPGGLEPLDNRLDNARSGSNNCAVPYLFYWRLPCPVQVTSPSEVTFQFNGLSAGTHSFSFLAIAASSGTWTFPPAQAYVNEQPEVLGLSQSSVFVVCADRTCTPDELVSACKIGGSGGCSGPTKDRKEAKDPVMPVPVKHWNKPKKRTRAGQPVRRRHQSKSLF